MSRFSFSVKVFLDYFLSREGQTAWSKASGLPSCGKTCRETRRPLLILKKGVRYLGRSLLLL
jgi:hypothetical protein